MQLESQKQHLELELESLTARLCSLPTLLELGSEVKFLNELIVQLEQENECARAVGMQNIEKLTVEYCCIEEERAALTTRTQEVAAVYQQ